MIPQDPSLRLRPKQASPDSPTPEGSSQELRELPAHRRQSEPLSCPELPCEWGRPPFEYLKCSQFKYMGKFPSFQSRLLYCNVATTPGIPPAEVKKSNVYTLNYVSRTVPCP